MGQNAKPPEPTEKAARQEKRKRRKKKTIVWLFLFVVLLLGSAAVTFAPAGTLPSWKQIFMFFGVSEPADQAMAQYPCTVQFLDVGKADSILISCEGSYMLVDAGDVSIAPQVAEYLQRREVGRLDYVVGTHADNDHIGGMAEVLSRFEVGRFLMPAVAEELLPDTPSYQKLTAVCQETGIRVEHPSPGDEWTLGGMKVRVLAPLQEYSDVNNTSLVLKLTYGKVSFLLTGDAERESEEAMLFSQEDLSADVLKVGHHGSETSSTEPFLEAVKPQYAVISVGEDRNNLPKDSVLDRLESVGAQIYRTDFQGTVIAATDGDAIEFFTER